MRSVDLGGGVRSAGLDPWVVPPLGLPGREQAQRRCLGAEGTAEQVFDCLNVCRRGAIVALARVPADKDLQRDVRVLQGQLKLGRLQAPRSQAVVVAGALHDQHPLSVMGPVMPTAHWLILVQRY